MNPVDISRDEVENLVASVIAETLWPDSARHDNPADLILNWIGAFPPEAQLGATKMLASMAISTLSKLTLAMMKQTGEREVKEEDVEWVRSYLLRLDSRYGMNKAVDSGD
jgi:hypothetical protein